MTVLRRAQSEARDIHVPVGAHELRGDLLIPARSRAMVLFAHGSGSSRFSPRNRFVAEVLNDAELATLLLDLLTPGEDAIDARTGHLRFDTSMLAERLAAVTDWLQGNPATADLPLGLFGASTGAAAALIAAANRSDAVRAVVSRGGRPDLAGGALSHVHAPTLLIVGGNDLEVLRLNQVAIAQIPAETKLIILHGASHLFEEPGALDEVARVAREWFVQFLGGQNGA